MRPPRTIVKAVVGSVAGSAPVAPWMERVFRKRVNVVYYHQVGAPTPYYESFYQGTTLERLAQDLQKLERYFEFTPLDLVVDEAAPRSGGRPPLAVTFDDGFDLLGNGAAAVLEKHGVRATSFLVTSCIDNVSLMWRNKLSAMRSLVAEERLVAGFNGVVAPLGLLSASTAAEVMRVSGDWPTDQKEELVDAVWEACELAPVQEFLAQYRPYFTTDGIHEWLRRGHSIGLHTRTHPYCDQLGPDGVEREIVEPAEELRARFGLPRLWFSYPFGNRLPPDVESGLYASGVFDGAFGIAGCARSATRPYRLERASAEDGLDFSVFGRAFLGRP